MGAISSKIVHFHIMTRDGFSCFLGIQFFLSFFFFWGGGGGGGGGEEDPGAPFQIRKNVVYFKIQHCSTTQGFS